MQYFDAAVLRTGLLHGTALLLTVLGIYGYALQHYPNTGEARALAFTAMVMEISVCFYSSQRVVRHHPQSAFAKSGIVVGGRYGLSNLASGAEHTGDQCTVSLRATGCTRSADQPLATLFCIGLIAAAKAYRFSSAVYLS
jgi:hypothetical protein